MGGNEMRGAIFPAYRKGTVAEAICLRHHEGRTVTEIAKEKKISARFVRDVIVGGWAKEGEVEVTA